MSVASLMGQRISGQPTGGRIIRSSALLWSRVTSFHPCSKTPPWGLAKLKKWRALFFSPRSLHGWKIQTSSSLVPPLLGSRLPVSHSPLGLYKGRFFCLECPSSSLHTHPHLKTSAHAISSREPSKWRYISFSDFPKAPVLPSVTAVYHTQC